MFPTNFKNKKISIIFKILFFISIFVTISYRIIMPEFIIISNDIYLWLFCLTSITLFFITYSFKTN